MLIEKVSVRYVCMCVYACLFKRNQCVYRGGPMGWHAGFIYALVSFFNTSSDPTHLPLTSYYNGQCHIADDKWHQVPPSRVPLLTQKKDTSE